MDIGSLLNPAGESYVLTEATDVDIYQAVMDAVEARENIDKNGGDDVDEDGPIKPCPARGDILQATPTISECLPYQNDPLARQLETLLGAFTRKLRIDETMNMKDTLLTDFYRIRSTDSD
ncbi:hypothetical protein EDB85DRAFT_1867292 [Lactarius pseudohatsudake]|nr:hypothetical protein EDB85DRAFT_1867292 [Lactarius pseudohatsudake]